MYDKVEIMPTSIDCKRSPVVRCANNKLELNNLIKILSTMATATNIGTLVTCSPDINNGRPMITGTKTSVSRVVVLYKQGANAEEIARRISHLNLAQVYAALAYYHVNRHQIETELAQAEAEYWNLAELHNLSKDTALAS
jgi:uncharacterized protein (DUF433 family)